MVYRSQGQPNSVSENICCYAQVVYKLLFGAAEEGNLSRAEVSQIFSSLVDGEFIPRKVAWSRVVGLFA